MRTFALLALLLALAGCGGSNDAAETPATTAAATTTTAAPTKEDVFAFDRDAPLELTAGESGQEETFTATAMSYASPGGDRVSGIVLQPEVERPAGVVFMHGAGGSRIDFLGDASELARSGAVALTIDSPFSRSESPEIRAGTAAPEVIHELMIRNVQDLVRALDVLVIEYGADPDRLAVVGYSMGVQHAAIAAALDDRVHAVVLMAGRANPSRTPGDPAWEKLFRDIDTVHFVPDLGHASVLYQGGEQDKMIPRAELEELYEATSEPKEIRWYPAGHGLTPKAGRERVAWLRRLLELR